MGLRLQRARHPNRRGGALASHTRGHAPLDRRRRHGRKQRERRVELAGAQTVPQAAHPRRSAHGRYRRRRYSSCPLCSLTAQSWAPAVVNVVMSSVALKLYRSGVVHMGGTAAATAQARCPVAWYGLAQKKSIMVKLVTHRS